MNSGTLVKVERYYNRYHYNSIEKLKSDIIDAEKAVERAKGALFAIAMSTPKDITPDGEDPVENMERYFNDAFDVYTDADNHLTALLDILDGWDTKVED